MPEGQIVKALAGFYYVDTGEAVYRCRARGKFRKDSVTPLVGDFVSITVQDEEEGVVDSIGPRQNAFIRPPVANVDIFVVTVATAEPEPSLELTDRFLVTAEAADAEACVCINKDDLLHEEAAKIAEVYEGVYPVVVMSALRGEGIPELKELIAGKSAAFAGASGVGKTSLVSLLTGRDELEIGSVSDKTGRGKQTTRHVEIFKLPDGTRIYDTPGFSSFETAEAAGLADANIDALFPEFEKYLGECRYADCRHVNEPDCAIRMAVKTGNVKESRYASYVRMLEAQRMKWEQ